MCREIKGPTNNSSDKAAAAVRTQQLNGEIKIHLIDDAIDALGGKWELLVRSLLGDSYMVSHGGEYAVIPSTVDPSYFESLPSVKVICTKAEFESRKAERQGKPDWKDLPPETQWLGQDRCGKWKPMVGPRPTTERGYWMTHHHLMPQPRGEVIGNWQDTLEQRPVGLGEAQKPKLGIRAARAKAWDEIQQRMVDSLFGPEAYHLNNSKPAKADWYDYDNQQALKLPPVGVECIALDDVHARIVGTTASGYLVYQNLSTGHCEMACQSTSFRPLDWERNNPKAEPEQSPELSFHLATAQNELQASAKLLPAESKLLQSITGVIAALQAIREAV